MGDESVVISDNITAASMYQAIANDNMATWITENPDVVKSAE